MSGALTAGFGRLFGDSQQGEDGGGLSGGGSEPDDVPRTGALTSEDPSVNDPEYFDPRAISGEGPTWENFVEYSQEVGPWLLGPLAAEVGAGYLVVSLASRGSRLIRWVPQRYMKASLERHGWYIGKMKPRSAKRGGWSKTLGQHPNVATRVQWGAAGGHHGGHYWKVTSTYFSRKNIPYFFSKSTF